VIGIETDGDSGIIVIPETIEPLLGIWKATVYDGDKEWNEHGRCITPVLFEHTQANLITTVGKQLLLDRVFGLSSTIALAGTVLGANATAAAVGDTYATFTTPAYKAFASTPFRSSLTVTALTSYLTSEANIAIAEAALSTAASGTILNRVAPFLSFTKTSAVALDITTTITQT
jgi:hypothetical protein